MPTAITCIALISYFIFSCVQLKPVSISMNSQKKNNHDRAILMVIICIMVLIILNIMLTTIILTIMKISEIIIVLQGVYIHYIVSQWRENGFETGKVTIFYNRDGDLQKVVIGIIIILHIQNRFIPSQI